MLVIIFLSVDGPNFEQADRYKCFGELFFHFLSFRYLVRKILL